MRQSKLTAVLHGAAWSWRAKKEQLLSACCRGGWPLQLYRAARDEQGQQQLLPLFALLGCSHATLGGMCPQAAVFAFSVHHKVAWVLLQGNMQNSS